MAKTGAVEPGTPLRLLCIDDRQEDAELEQLSLSRAGYGIEYEGFDQKDCHPVTGDQTRAAITWAAKANLDELKGRYIRLRIHGRNLTAYSAAFEA